MIEKDRLLIALEISASAGFVAIEYWWAGVLFGLLAIVTAIRSVH